MIGFSAICTLLSCGVISALLTPSIWAAPPALRSVNIRGQVQCPVFKTKACVLVVNPNTISERRLELLDELGKGPALARFYDRQLVRVSGLLEKNQLSVMGMAETLPPLLGGIK